MLPFDPRCSFTPAALDVAPELVGLPLAMPKSRLYATGLDLAATAPAAPELDAETAPTRAASSAVIVAAAFAPIHAERIATLQAEQAEARKPGPTDPRAEVGRQLHAIGLKFDWGIVPFSQLPT